MSESPALPQVRKSFSSSCAPPAGKKSPDTNGMPTEKSARSISISKQDTIPQCWLCRRSSGFRAALIPIPPSTCFERREVSGSWHSQPRPTLTLGMVPRRAACSMPCLLQTIMVSGSCRYKVLRPGQSADEPRVLLDRREPSDERFTPRFRVQAEMDWFAITTGRERKLDREPGVFISRYEVTGDSVRRLHPLALTPEDFLDVWAPDVLGRSRALEH